MRRSFLFILALILVGVAIAGFWYLGSRQKPGPVVTADAPQPDPAPTPEPTPPPPAPTPVPTPQPDKPIAQPIAQQPPVPAHTRELVNVLAKLPATPEEVALWRTNFSLLVQQGAAAIPAIREFLQQTNDIAYDFNLMGTHSLRLALLQAIEAIGGPEAIELAAATLQTTFQPREIQQIARHLESQAQGLYRDAILHATRQSLDKAAAGQLGKTDAGPLFNVLVQHGGAETVPDLQKAASPYRYYSAIALAQLPDGVGIPALAEMLRSPGGPAKGTHGPALEALAQLASQHAGAAERLLEQAQLKQIPDTLWPSIANALVGAKMYLGNPTREGLSLQSGDKTYHLAQGPQDFFSRASSAALPPEQAQQAAQIIAQLLATGPPALGAEALQKSAERLAER